MHIVFAFREICSTRQNYQRAPTDTDALNDSGTVANVLLHTLLSYSNSLLILVSFANKAWLRWRHKVSQRRSGHSACAHLLCHVRKPISRASTATNTTKYPRQFGVLVLTLDELMLQRCGQR